MLILYYFVTFSYILALLLSYFVTFLEARWRVRSFAALLDPPRQALCLRMAYRVRYPNQPAHIPFLLIILPNLPFPQDIIRIYIHPNPSG